MMRLLNAGSCLLALAATVTAGALDQAPFAKGKSQVTPKWHWKDCGTEDPFIVRISSIEIAPDPPVPGQNLTLTVKGAASNAVMPGATADVVVKMGFITVLKKTFDICDEADKAEAEMRCPVEKGDHTVVHSVELPKLIPRQSYMIHVDGYTAEDQDLLCLDLAIDFRN